MARSITTRQVPSFIQQGKPVPGASPEVPIMTFFDQPQGEDRVIPVSRMGPNLSPFVENLRFLTDNRYSTRSGTSMIGTGAATAVCGIAVFSFTDGNDYIIRVTTTGVDFWTGSVWQALMGPTLAIYSWTFVEFTVWNNQLVFTDRFSGLYSINITAGSYSLISGSPIGRHLTTFNSRIIVSNIVSPIAIPTRIQWSVKDDDTDYVGLGSGFEDLLSAPGGTVDIQRGVIPISDTDAFVVRSNSLWIMSTTGYFDAPFSFVQRFDQGTDAPQTIIRVPGEKVAGQTIRTLYSQIIMLGTDDVVMMKPEGVFPLGSPIRDQLLGASLNVRRAIAGFEPRMREYRLYVPPLSDDNTESTVWRYQIDNHFWTHDTFPFQLRRMAFKDILSYTSYDDLVGTYDQQTGPFDEWGLLNRDPNGIFAIEPSNGVVRETLSNLTDVDGIGHTLGIPIEIRTGLVQPAGPLFRSQILMCELEYEATQSVPVEIDYSEDGGITWLLYKNATVPATTLPTIFPFRYTIERGTIMLRVTSTNAGGLKFHALHVTAVRGSSINN